jgi:hypothetical protein
MREAPPLDYARGERFRIPASQPAFANRSLRSQLRLGWPKASHGADAQTINERSCLAEAA